MIVTEYYMTRPDGVRLNRTLSNAGMYIQRDGMLFEDAIDPEGMHREYAETDIPIEREEDDAAPEDYEAALGEMGVSV